jgi:hypothetical protein
METSENLTSSLPYIVVVVSLLFALLVLALMKRGKDKTETRSCPHCKEMVDTDANVCNFCNRKISHL